MASPRAKYSRRARTVMRAVAMATTAVELRRTMATTAGVRMAAVAMRFQVILKRALGCPWMDRIECVGSIAGRTRQFTLENGRELDLAGGGGGFDGAVAAFPFLEIDQGFEEAGAIEIGPERFSDEDLGVGNLPEEEIADRSEKPFLV